MDPELQTISAPITTGHKVVFLRLDRTWGVDGENGQYYIQKHAITLPVLEFWIICQEKYYKIVITYPSNFNKYLYYRVKLQNWKSKFLSEEVDYLEQLVLSMMTLNSCDTNFLI